MYSALELSKYIESKCIREQSPISNLQLQKILYFVQREFLQKRGEPAFEDSTQAWQFGPVVPEVYYYFCGFGAMPISHLYGEHHIEPKDVSLVDGIVEAKRQLPPWDLVAESHQSNGAWDQIYQNGAGDREVIPIELIRAAG